MTRRSRVPRAARPVAIVSTTISRTVEGFYRDIIRELRTRGYDVHVVTSSGPEIERLDEIADAVHIVPMQRRISATRDAVALARWLVLLRKTRPQLVFAGTPKAGLLGMIAARLVGVPRRVYFLQGLRSEGYSGLRRRALESAERVTSWCSVGVVAVSDSLARAYLESGLESGRPVQVPHHGSSHGVDSSHFAPMAPSAEVARRLGLDPAVPVLLFVGRLTRDKGMDSLIEACLILKSWGLDFQLLVVGAQDEADSATYLSRLAGTDVRVAVVDHTSDIREYIALAYALLLPTRREGLPNAVLESAAMGVPAVTTIATGAIDSVVPRRTGLLVPTDNPELLAWAARKLLLDPELRDSMGSAAREDVARRFAPELVAQAIVGIALNGRPPSSPMRYLTPAWGEGER